MAETSQRRLIVFTRYPEPGKAKTRLIPALGAEGAAELQRSLTLRAATTARQAARRLSLQLEICYAGGEPEDFHIWLGPGLFYQPQAPGDIGQRMAEAFRSAFEQGDESVVLIGTDVPGLTAEILSRAFEALESADVALGPALDGGYYLIGLRRAAPGLFSGIAWSTSAVLNATLERAKALGLSVMLLEPLSDIDRPEDLAAWRAAVEDAD